ncbi:hypothetical protein Q4504_00035 [Mesomycoplasma ovipneumoniae]|uniref:hypothetical protein n=1 Tax=Mesomycoplasma ovipneumoniae TaxID=29562 RepID=UPI0026E36E50|nr:hypothetical protein [Mesomycoplasma ovipneumoniae]MDO6825796.1 hypothetical protein [Mesomycoplasma ovipneumoniae]MDO6856859.1 hypothetical protein [Mesomycoplasma ovipneumoniae]MDW2923927.1 hypothetical protein [Mesomycoplasma ovipneumoniae]MDW2930658.1 hypothetical protein [Mesomycoplasma ovipneumoniae]
MKNLELINILAAGRALENDLKEKIRKIIANINKLSGNIINFQNLILRKYLLEGINFSWKQ